MIVAICSLFASCMGDSYAETDENMPSPYGNNELKETNLISIANLKAKFATPINTDYRDGKSYERCVMILRGSAGTGKTSLASVIVRTLLNLQYKIRLELLLYQLVKVIFMGFFLLEQRYS